MQQFVLSKMFPIPRYTDEELKALEKEFNKSNKQRKKQEKARVRSLHHIDDDDYDENGNLRADASGDSTHVYAKYDLDWCDWLCTKAIVR